MKKLYLLLNFVLAFTIMAKAETSLFIDYLSDDDAEIALNVIGRIEIKDEVFRLISVEGTELAACKSLGGSQIIGADAVIVVMVKLDRGEFWIEDGAIASGYILLAAEQYDVGACWVHIRNRRGRKGSSDEEIRELLDVPDGYAVLNLIALGGKGEIKRGYTESDFDFSKVHQELF